MKKSVPLAALAVLSLVAACSHHGARHFSAAEPPTENPPPASPPPSPPPPPPGGTLTRATDDVTNVAGGVLHVVGNTVLGVGDALDEKGIGGVPVVGSTASNIVEGADTHLNGVAQVQVVNAPIIGADAPGGNQAIGVSALSQTPSTGTVATVGVLNQGSQQQVANVSLGGAQVLGTSGPAAVNVGLLNGVAPPSGSANPLGAVTSATSGSTGPLVSLIGKHP